MAVRWRSQRGSFAARGAASALGVIVCTGCADGKDLVPAPDIAPPFEGPFSQIPKYQLPAWALRDCPSATEQVVSYSVDVLTWDTLLPPPQLEVQACAGADLDCLHPFARSEFEAPAEHVTIDVPTGFTGVFEFRAPGHDPTVLWLSHPLCQDERAQLPVWLLEPASDGPAGSVSATGANRLLLQRVDCQGALQPFPIGGTSAVIRVSGATASSGNRTFTNFSGLPVLAGETDTSRTRPDLIAFSELPTDQDLAIEVFDYVDRYEVVYVSMFVSETAIATAFLVNCGESKRGPH